MVGSAFGAWHLPALRRRVAWLAERGDGKLGGGGGGAEIMRACGEPMRSGVNTSCLLHSRRRI